MGLKRRSVERPLRDTWLQYSVCRHFDWNAQQSRTEAWCPVTQAFQTRFLHDLMCQARQRQASNEGQAHCLTGCQNAPTPDKKYCGLRLMDSEPDALTRHVILSLHGMWLCEAALRVVDVSDRQRSQVCFRPYPAQLMKVTGGARTYAWKRSPCVAMMYQFSSSKYSVSGF